MSNICKTVTLRTRKIKGGEQLSFYLDYYPGYRDESTMKVMRHESLGIYIYAKPKNQREKDYNERHPLRRLARLLQCLAPQERSPFPVFHAVLPQELQVQPLLVRIELLVRLVFHKHHSSLFSNLITISTTHIYHSENLVVAKHLV